MKAVLDVGQFVSATVKTIGHPAQILDAWEEGHFELVTSLSILSDLRRVLFYPHIRKRHHLDDEAIHAFVDRIARSATLTPGTLTVSVVKADPADDKVLACAERARLTILWQVILI